MENQSGASGAGELFKIGRTIHNFTPIKCTAIKLIKDCPGFKKGDKLRFEKQFSDKEREDNHFIHEEVITSIQCRQDKHDRDTTMVLDEVTPEKFKAVAVKLSCLPPNNSEVFLVTQ